MIAHTRLHAFARDLRALALARLGDSSDRHRHERGQVLPIAVLFMSIFIIFTIFLVDIAGIMTVAGHAVSGSLRAGGLAALETRGTLDDYGRWYVIGDGSLDTNGDTVARQYVALNLIGDSTWGAGGYTNVLGSGTSLDSLLSSGTSDGAANGLDVEILNPAAQDTQTPDAWLNGVSETAVTCTSTSFPQPLQSSIDGQCYDTATVILRIKIPARHIFGTTFGTIDDVVVVKAGTDAN